MLTFKRSKVIRKIIIGLFLAINVILLFVFLSPCLIGHIHLSAYATFVFGDSSTRQELLLATGIFALEIFTIPSLFASKSQYKLIGNIILHIMCVVGIGFCISLITENVDLPQMIIVIILDIVFMVLMIYDIIKSNKEYFDTSDEKFFKER